MAAEKQQHNLVPEHSLLSEKEKTALLEELRISTKHLPKIKQEDPAIIALNAKAGDVVKVVRMSRSAGKAVYYRAVIES